MHRQAKHPTRQAVAYGATRLSGECRLLVQRQGIMHDRRYACFSEMGGQSISIVTLHRVLRPNAGIAGQNDRKLQILAREMLIIGLRRGISLDQLVFEYLKFRQQYRSLKCVQPAIHTDANVVIATLLAMSRDLAQDHGEVIIVSEHRTAVTITAKRLGWEEAGTSYF